MKALDRLNAAPEAEIIRALSAIYEHSPWVAEAVVEQRPFTDVDALAAAMARAVAMGQPDLRLAVE